MLGAVVVGVVIIVNGVVVVAVILIVDVMVVVGVEGAVGCVVVVVRRDEVVIGVPRVVLLPFTGSVT